MVDVLERDGQGLNLTEQVRDGILNHTGPEKPATLEGRVVRLVDRVAYINHDIDDALRAGIISERRPAGGGDRAAGADRVASGSTRWCATSSSARGRRGTSRRARRSAGRCCGCASSCSTGSTSGPEARGEHERVQRTLRLLFDHYLEHPDEMPAGHGAARRTTRSG